MKENTDFMSGYDGIPPKPTHKGGMKVMDWERAKWICLQNPTSIVMAGILEDWNNTSGIVYDKGKFIRNLMVFGVSLWGTPIVDVDGKEIECWMYEVDLPQNMVSSDVPEWWEKSSK